MTAEFLQFLFSGITIGSAYALVALGFSIIYNTSHVINFAQGEFVMLGGMSTVFLIAMGFPYAIAAFIAVLITIGIGLLLEKLAIEPARDSSVVTIIIITIGASIFLRGVAQIVLDKQFHALPSFTGDDPIIVGGATILPQSMWVMFGTGCLVAVLWYFFSHTILGKAMLATAYNRLAAQLVGVNTRMVLLLSFGLAAMLGSVGGILIAPLSAASSSRHCRRPTTRSASCSGSRDSAPRSSAGWATSSGPSSGGWSSASPRPWGPATFRRNTRTPSPSC